MRTIALNLLLTMPFITSLAFAQLQPFSAKVLQCLIKNKGDLKTGRLPLLEARCKNPNRCDCLSGSVRCTQQMCVPRYSAKVTACLKKNKGDFLTGRLPLLEARCQNPTRCDCLSGGVKCTQQICIPWPNVNGAPSAASLSKVIRN